ncbi:MAG: hypothetical protein L0177_06705 [Chloroflexi bacterium]|nr:hypothetical protein [Chloroflexota bacterium]
MLKSFRNLKILAVVSALLVAMLAAGVAHGGVLWTGIDPELRVGERNVNIWVEWPDQYTCAVESIKIDVAVPRHKDVTLVGESVGVFDCGDGSVNIVETKTKLKATGGDRLRISGKLKASESFPYRIVVYVDDELVFTCEAESNRTAHCEQYAVSFDDDDDDRSRGYDRGRGRHSDDDDDDD